LFSRLPAKYAFFQNVVQSSREAEGQEHRARGAALKPCRFSPGQACTNECPIRTERLGLPVVPQASLALITPINVGRPFWPSL
jgi:hypothetical protein